MTPATNRGELLAALEHEREALATLLPRFTDEQWRAAARADGWTVHDIASHLADANYGLARLVLGELPPALPQDQQTGMMNPHDFNDIRRAKNAALPREKVISRMASAFEHARRAIETTDDLEAPGPYGPTHTKGQWLRRIVDHARDHRQELEQLLG